jgi:hypothetical protein
MIRQRARPRDSPAFRRRGQAPSGAAWPTQFGASTREQNSSPRRGATALNERRSLSLPASPSSSRGARPSRRRVQAPTPQKMTGATPSVKPLLDPTRAVATRVQNAYISSETRGFRTSTPVKPRGPNCRGFLPSAALKSPPFPAPNHPRKAGFEGSNPSVGFDLQAAGARPGPPDVDHARAAVRGASLSVAVVFPTAIDGRVASLARRRQRLLPLLKQSNAHQPLVVERVEMR